MTLSADIYGDDDTPIEDHDVSIEALHTLTRRYVRAVRKLNEIRAPFHDEIKRLCEREEWATKSSAQYVADLSQQIRHVVLGLLEQDPRTKSWKLPHGTVQSRTTAPAIDIADEAVFISWAADDAPELLRYMPKIDKRAVKTRLSILPDGETVATAAGELVPGVVVSPQTTTVHVSEATADDESEF